MRLIVVAVLLMCISYVCNAQTSLDARVSVLESQTSRIFTMTRDMNGKVATKEDVNRLERQNTELRELLLPLVAKTGILEKENCIQEKQIERIHSVAFGVFIAGIGTGSYGFVRFRRNGRAKKSG